MCQSAKRACRDAPLTAQRPSAQESSYYCTPIRGSEHGTPMGRGSTPPTSSTTTMDSMHMYEPIQCAGT